LAHVASLLVVLEMSAAVQAAAGAAKDHEEAVTASMAKRPAF